MEMTLACNALLDRLPGLRLDPDATDVHVHGYVFRTPYELPVRFEAG
jgi:cytochrome P450